MRKSLCWLLLAALLLSGCGRRSDRHGEWDASWLRFDDHLAVETPEGFSLEESRTALSAAGIFYGRWTAGGHADSDAQLHLLLTAESGETDAQKSISKWLAAEKQSYQLGKRINWETGGQSYRIYPLVQPKEESAFSHGAVAFAVRGSSAVCAELLCSDAFEGDAVAVLKSFLTTVRYGEN